MSRRNARKGGHPDYGYRLESSHLSPHRLLHAARAPFLSRVSILLTLFDLTETALLILLGKSSDGGRVGRKSAPIKGYLKGFLQTNILQLNKILTITKMSSLLCSLYNDLHYYTIICSVQLLPSSWGKFFGREPS